jgi:putative glycosyltransferase (TIGR04372 family)
MKALLRRVKNVANDRFTRVLFYDQTLKKGYASLAQFPKLFIFRRVLITLIAYPLSLMCWVFLVLLNLFTPVRIYRFKRPQRPGFASVYIEQLEPLCRELQATGHKGFLIFIDASQTTNLELLKLYATHFNLYLDDRIAFVRTIIALIPKLCIPNTFLNYSYYDKNWLLTPSIKLGTGKQTETPELISELNLDRFKFVIFAHRSVAYDAKYHKNASLELNRNTDISKAESAILRLHERDLKIVRMGTDTDDLPDSLKLLPIIDLSGKFRTDAQDLWLAEHCLFFWGVNGVGTWHFAHKYNRPTLVTNTYELIRGHQHTLFAFQLIWDERRNRHLSLFEMINLRGVVGKVSEMKAHGLTFVENSASELLESVSEMLDYLDNKLQYSEHDLSLFSQFNDALVKSGHPPMLKNHSRPCISFLQQNRSLL